jgi:hypothetical protein
MHRFLFGVDFEDLKIGGVGLGGVLVEVFEQGNKDSRMHGPRTSLKPTPSVRFARLLEV